MTKQLTVRELAEWLALYDEEEVVGTTRSGYTCPVRYCLLHQGIDAYVCRDASWAARRDFHVGGTAPVVEHGEPVRAFIDAIDDRGLIAISAGECRKILKEVAA